MRPDLPDSEFRRCWRQAALSIPSSSWPSCWSHETGHRLSSVRQLRWTDVDLKASTVRWRSEADKIGFEGTTELTEAARRALEAHRSREAAIGQVWVFPAKRGPSGPRSRHTFAKWWVTVANEAKLAPVKGRRFHSLRRKFATEMKHAPLRDLAHLGGWKSVSTVVEVYQRPDRETMQRASARRPITDGGASGVQLGTEIRHQAAEQ